MRIHPAPVVAPAGIQKKNPGKLFLCIGFVPGGNLDWSGWQSRVSEHFRAKTTAHGRTPQSAHHPHKSHDEHCQCNPGGGIHFAVLVGSDNSYTTPFEIPFLIRSPLWWRYMVGGPLHGCPTMISSSVALSICSKCTCSLCNLRSLGEYPATIASIPRVA